MRPLILFLALLLLSPAFGNTRRPLDLAQTAQFTLYQRSTIAIPGSAGELLLSIDDITAGQTMVSLEWRDGERVLGPRSLRVDESLEFAVASQSWRLQLTRMHNELIGNDWVEFTLMSASAALSTTPEQEIEALLAAIAALDAQFLRNGEFHSGAAAAAHLRQKWRAAGDSVRSAEDFIALIASHSASGEIYRIRSPDGHLESAGDWLSRRLREQRSNSAPRPALQST